MYKLVSKLKYHCTLGDLNLDFEEIDHKSVSLISNHIIISITQYQRSLLKLLVTNKLKNV